MFIRKIPNGDYYVCRKPSNKKDEYRNWFLIKRNGGSGYVPTNFITFPKEFIGKKIRLKVEVVEDGTSK